MSSAIDPIDIASENMLGPGGELRIRLGESVDEMRSRFDEFIQQNPDSVVEQDPSGELVIMSPAGAEGSSKNSDITFQLTRWAREYGGAVFDSSAMFVFANGAKRSMNPPPFPVAKCFQALCLRPRGSLTLQRRSRTIGNYRNLPNRATKSAVRQL